MEKSSNNSMPMQESQNQRSFCAKQMVMGLIAGGLLLVVPGIAVLAQSTSHSSDVFTVANATVAVTLGAIIIAVTIIYACFRSIPTIRSIRFRSISRRGFRFSLRTLLVLVTLVCILCGYLGWAMNWKRQRNIFLNSIQTFAATKDITIWSGDHAPAVLRILGENGYRTIPVKASEVEEARRLFPESEIYVIELDGER